MTLYSTMLSKEDQEVERWRQTKLSEARALRKYDRDRKRSSQTALLAAAKGVICNWSSGDLACAVRDLDAAIKEYEEARK